MKDLNEINAKLPLPPMQAVSFAHVAAICAASKFEDTKLGQKTTVVCLTLPNGFELVESSSCVSPELYSHERGIEICEEKLRARIWFLEGYMLQQRLAQGTKTES